MKSTLLLAAVLITMQSLLTAQNTNPDFRGLPWGSSLAKVKETETEKLSKQDKDDRLIYSDILAGSDCDVIYQFNDNNKLVSGIYVFTKVYQNPQLYLQDYYKFIDILKGKYGPPELSKEEWLPNSVPSDKVNYGQAIADGELVLYNTWSTDQTSIKITLINIATHPSLQIIYTAKKLNELENKEALQKAAMKL